MEELYAIEYSQKKQWLRTVKLSKIISANIENLRRNVESDFLILGVYSSEKEADIEANFLIKDLELKLKQ
jgi:uncharacterized protein YjlB